MDIGFLRRKIIFQQQASAQNTRGEMVPTWTTYYTCRAGIEPLTGRELLAAMQVQADISHRVTIRWPGATVTLDPSMRILFGTRYFDINSILNTEERNRTLELLCTERVGQT